MEKYTSKEKKWLIGNFENALKVMSINEDIKTQWEASMANYNKTPKSLKIQLITGAIVITIGAVVGGILGGGGGIAAGIFFAFLLAMIIYAILEKYFEYSATNKQFAELENVVCNNNISLEQVYMFSFQQLEVRTRQRHLTRWQRQNPNNDYTEKIAEDLLNASYDIEKEIINLPGNIAIKADMLQHIMRHKPMIVEEHNEKPETLPKQPQK